MKKLLTYLTLTLFIVATISSLTFAGWEKDMDLNLLSA